MNDVSDYENHSRDITHNTTGYKKVSAVLGDYTSDEIMLLAKSKEPKARNELMYVISDLIEESLSGREKDLIGDILINLVRQAVRDVRAAISSKLSHRDDVPEQLILHLAHDEIEVARHILLNSPLLSDDDLLYLIRCKSVEYADCIARRRELSAPIIDAIADKRILNTCKHLAQNNHISLTEYAYKVLGEMVMTESELAGPLLTRQDVPVELARKLYEHVGKSMQKYIEEKFGHEVAAKAAKDVTDELIGAARNRFRPTEDIREEVAIRKREGRLTLKETMDTLRRGQIPSFIAMFSEYMDLSEKSTEEILRENSGRSLAVVCRYEGISRADFVAIYLMAHKIRSYEQIVPQNELQKALKYFDHIDPPSARKLMQELKRKDRH